MLSQWILAAIHLFAFALAFWAVLARGRASSLFASGTGAAKRVLLADNLWGLSALTLLVTGAMRAFGGYEKRRNSPRSIGNVRQPAPEVKGNIGARKEGEASERSQHASGAVPSGVKCGWLNGA
jgi:hypothetical protein